MFFMRMRLSVRSDLDVDGGEAGRDVVQLAENGRAVAQQHYSAGVEPPISRRRRE
jgi:hypothetical protein